MTVAVLIGLQASGKSTFAATSRFTGWVRLSKDHWPQARHRQRRQLRLLDEALTDGRDVVVDNTNPSAAEWDPLVRTARRHGSRTEAYWFPPDPAASWSRNAARPDTSRVPEVGLRDVLGRLTRPAPDSGFDVVWAVQFDGAGGFAVTEEEVTRGGGS